jgi:hypothetical protein
MDIIMEQMKTYGLACFYIPTHAAGTQRVRSRATDKYSMYGSLKKDQIPI